MPHIAKVRVTLNFASLSLKHQRNIYLYIFHTTAPSWQRYIECVLGGVRAGFKLHVATSSGIKLVIETVTVHFTTDCHIITAYWVKKPQT